MSEANKALIHYWANEGFNKNNIGIADGVYDANVYYHEPSAGQVIGLEPLKQFVRTWRLAFPDSKLTIEEQVAEGDNLATRWTFTGTHMGEFRGLAPTGKPMEMSAMYFYRFAKGKVVEIHAMVNLYSLLYQLGAIPLIGQANTQGSNTIGKFGEGDPYHGYNNDREHKTRK
jgi:steroid delta-isomerase-like uncharacterized protein